MSKNQRPGVYSSYSVTSRYATPRSRKGAAIAAVTDNSSIERISGLSGLTDLMGKISLPEHVINSIRILLGFGVSFVCLSSAKNGYKKAVTQLSSHKDIGIVISDATQTAEILDSIVATTENSNNQNEHLCFFGGENMETALQTANHTSHERAVVTCPSLVYDDAQHSMYGAAALAGAVLTQGDPAYNFNGFSFTDLDIKNSCTEEEIQKLITGGVTVFEKTTSAIQCIRAVTTKNADNNSSDLSMRSINTILIIDDVMQTIRQSLKEKLKGQRISTQSLDSIASQVIVELNAKKNQGLLESYDTPIVYPHEIDPSICVVEISFTVVHVISQIHITAHIEL